MKYSEIDLQCEDIMWFGIDINGVVFECTSGGIGCVPSFVCESKENTEMLENFFLTQLKPSTQGTVLLSQDENPLLDEVKSLSEKGVVCFDVAVDDDRPNEYKKIAIPGLLLKTENLPESIKSIMSHHMVDVDVVLQKFIKVPHAF